MKDINETLDAYYKIGKEIGKFFGTSVWAGIEDFRNLKWYDTDDGDITWFDEDDEEYGSEVYGTSKWEKGGLVMFTAVDNGVYTHYIFAQENFVGEE